MLWGEARIMSWLHLDVQTPKASVLGFKLAHILASLISKRCTFHMIELVVSYVAIFGERTTFDPCSNLAT